MVTDTTSTRVRLFHPKSMTNDERGEALLDLARSYDTPAQAVHMLIGVIAACVTSAGNIETEEDVIEICAPVCDTLTVACVDCFRHANGAKSAVALQ